MRHVFAVGLAAATLVLSACGGEDSAPARDRVSEPVVSVANGDLLFARGDYTRGYERWRVFAAHRGGGRSERVSPLAFAEPPLPSPNGRWLAFSEPPSDDGSPQRVRLVRLRGTRTRPLTRGRPSDAPGQWSPEGRRLLVAHFAAGGYSSVSVVNVFGRGRRFVTTSEGSAVAGAVWAPTVAGSSPGQAHSDAPAST